MFLTQNMCFNFAMSLSWDSICQQDALMTCVALVLTIWGALMLVMQRVTCMITNESSPQYPFLIKGWPEAALFPAKALSPKALFIQLIKTYMYK